jgi:UDP:flavonoid glycosyltransferase YjiC (YdhE family)
MNRLVSGHFIENDKPIVIRAGTGMDKLPPRSIDHHLVIRQMMLYSAPRYYFNPHVFRLFYHGRALRPSFYEKSFPPASWLFNHSFGCGSNCSSAPSTKDGGV